MSTEKMREEFEVAYIRDLVGSSTKDAPLWLERGTDGEYRSFQARGAWWAWRASIAAIEVELPEPFGAFGCMGEGMGEADTVIDYEGAVEAIESLGIKVKP